MLKPQDVEIQFGRTSAGDFMSIVHTPTGIRRHAGPPLPKAGKVKHEMLGEIEAELLQKGLTQHILPNKKSRLR